MARHFWQLYLLIVATLIAGSWVQDRLTPLSAASAAKAATVDTAQSAVLDVMTTQLRDLVPEQRERFVADLAARTRLELNLLDLHDIAGSATLARLERGEPAVMQGADGDTWLLQRLADADQVLAFEFRAEPLRRSALEWMLTFAFYAAIALVIMMWLWPLTHDLRQLERSTTTFGDRNWKFDAPITARSQVYPLAQAFRRMAARIDGLIGSHQDMTNAMSHEIKTPLARMRFEVEVARGATTQAQFHQHLDHINTDIAELNSFVSATLDYAILERAEVALNLDGHDFTQILPALVDHVRDTTRSELTFACEVGSGARAVRCDVHLLETVVRNLLYNAARYARSAVRLTFEIDAQGNDVLLVDDDGPGIPAAERRRVFESFVQLAQPSHTKSGFGLGLAIVSRIVEWHRGTVAVEDSPLGGARFRMAWRGATL